MGSLLKPVSQAGRSSVLVVLGLSMLSCRPVMTVGWTEILILFALVAFLFGPLLFRIFTWWQKVKADQQEKENREK